MCTRMSARPRSLRWLIGACWVVGLGWVAAHGHGTADRLFLQPVQKPPVRQESSHLGDMLLRALFVTAAIAGGAHEAQRRISLSRKLQRPYSVKNPQSGDVIQDPYRYLTQVITFLQDEIIKPLDEQLPGRPFENDCHSFPFIPMVLVIGNHSSGKSTFINRLLGLQIQETGVAPTDDGFTVLERHASIDEMEDGPTLLGCRENKPFRELQRFGQSFTGRFKRKRVTAAESEGCFLPEGLQIVDTPGMIDMPGNSGMAGGRGYNFLEVVRWFAKRADLILLLFDPDKPGTTGEALDVLTKSLAGLDHKFLIVLNKVDTLDNSVDFARAYGTLGWALSKVIPRKDIPNIYTMYNAGFDGKGTPNSERKSTGTSKEHKLPLEAFMAKREEVINEVLRAKVRHWDNVVTAFEETLRQLEMVLTVSRALHIKVQLRRLLVWSCGVATMVCIPVLVTLMVMYARWVPPVKPNPVFEYVPMLASLPMIGQEEAPRKWWVAPWPYDVVRWEILLGVSLLYTIACIVVGFLLSELCSQYERLQVTSELDSYFEVCYARFFIHTDGEDHKWRWASVRIKIRNMALSGTVAELPLTPSWRLEQIRECLQQDCWYLRQLARLLRGTEPGTSRHFNLKQKKRSEGHHQKVHSGAKGA